MPPEESFLYQSDNLNIYKLCDFVLQFNVIGTNILVITVFHTETAGNRSKLLEAKMLIQVPRMCIGFNHGIKLKYSEAKLSSSF